MRKRWLVISSTSTAVAIAVAAALWLRPAPTAKVELPTPGHIPAEVRAALSVRMQRHGAQMSELVLRLVVLDRDGAARIAGRIHDEPPVQKGAADDDVGRALPARFFELQEELRREARALVMAAARQEPSDLAGPFAALTQTCVRCHEAYLAGGAEGR